MCSVHEGLPEHAVYWYALATHDNASGWSWVEEKQIKNYAFD